MAAALSLVGLLLTAPVTRSARVDVPKLEQGQKLFNQGDFDGALRVLDAVAASESVDPTTLDKVHLLRAQCFAARQDFVRAEEAFALALEANPESTLDPARVDPTLVKMLEAARARLTALFSVASSPQGALLKLDGRDIGTAPQTLAVPPGKHQLEARWGDAPSERLEFQVKPRSTFHVEWVQGAAVPVAQETLLVPRPLRPFGDLRGMFEPATTGSLSGGLELGGGFELQWFRVALFARLFPNFGVTPRFQLALPVLEHINVVLELGLPMNFLSGGFGLGIGGGGGAEYYPLKWLGAYVLIGGSHHFLWPNRNDRTAFTATGGIRLRIP